MNLLEKLKLTSELDQIANEVASGTLPLMARIQKVRRIDEIIAALTAEQPTTATTEKPTLQDIVNKKQILGVCLRPQYDFERCVRDYVSSGIEDNKLRTEFLHAMNQTKPKGSDATYLRDQLAIDLENGVYVQKNKHGKTGFYIGPYLKPDNPFWGMLEWLYENNRLVTGDKALNSATEDDMFSANTDDEPQTTVDQDFEQEAKPDLINPPVDEAGAFYQSVIDGAEVDVDLVQKAIEYAKQDESHYLLPEAAEVIKQAVLSNIA